LTKRILIWLLAAGYCVLLAYGIYFISDFYTPQYPVAEKYVTSPAPADPYRSLFETPGVRWRILGSLPASSGIIGAPKETGTFSWSPEALRRLGRVPPFVRPMAMKGVEMFAQTKGYREITGQVLDEAYGKECSVVIELEFPNARTAPFAKDLGLSGEGVKVRKARVQLPMRYRNGLYHPGHLALGHFTPWTDREN
jgi:hypothetical protein